jgi:hypothetical protein
MYLRKLTRLIQRHVIWQNQRASRAQTQTLAHCHTRLLKTLDLLEQRFRRQHNPITDQTLHALAQNAGRNQVQNRLLAINNQCMVGIMPTLKACYRCNSLGQQVDDLAFAFVAPLRAQNNYVSTHCCL